MAGERGRPAASTVTILVPEGDPAAEPPSGADRGADTGPRVEVVGDPDAAPDAFPSARFAELIRRLPRYLRLAWGLAGEPAVPRSRRAAVIAAAAYLASPVDLVPGVIPVVGQLDDVAVTVLALRAALRAVDEPTRQRLLGEAGLGRIDLDRDVETAGLAALWLARRGARLTRRLLRLAVAATMTAGRVGARAATSVAGRSARAGRRAAPRAAAALGGAGASVGGAGASAVGGAGRAAGSVRRRLARGS